MSKSTAEKGTYYQLKFDQKCDKNERIEKIVCLKYNIWKHIFIVWPLNIITLFFIQFSMIWFPHWKITLLYSIVENPNEATHFAVTNKDDGDVEIVKKKQLNLEEYQGNIRFLQKHYKSNFFELKELCILTYKLFQYFYLKEKEEFVPLKFEMNMSFETLQSIKRGISTKEREYIIQILGKCLIEVKVMKFMKILFICISDPFYCFQVFTVVLWIYEDYSYYICGIVITTSSAIVLEVWSTLHSSNKIKKMAESTIMVNRMNSDGEFEEVESKYLAVGDILEIPNSGQVIPCDCILLSGDVIVNESVLTGESTTVVKSNIQENKVGGEFKPDKDQSLVKYILLTGTKVVQKRISKKVSHNNEEFSNVIDFNNSCLAYVYKTGYDSEKGNLIRSIVNPKDKESNFRRESLYFLFTMLSLVFCSYLILFPTITYGKFGTILVTLLDLSTIGAPPALPGYLGVSTVIALFNLRDNGILTIKRGKILLHPKLLIVFSIKQEL